MDFTIVGSLVGGLLIAIPAIAAYFRRSTRATRRENRRLRALVQEQDLHMYRLERLGWTRHGRRPPARPALLQALHADDEADELDEATPAAGPAGGAEPDPGGADDEGAGGGTRHRTAEG